MNDILNDEIFRDTIVTLNKRRYWLVFSLCMVFLFIIIFHDGFVLIKAIWLFATLSLIMIITSPIQTYCDEEYIILKKGVLIYQGKGFNKKNKEERIPLGSIETILWENELYTSGSGSSRNSIYLVDEQTNKHVIVKNRSANYRIINSKALEKLSVSLNIPIQKEYYVLSGDLKTRKKRE